MNNMKQSALGVAVAMALVSGAAQAAYTPVVTTTGNNFTMVSVSNSLTGGTNDVTFTWNDTLYNSVVRDGSHNATLSSPTAFSGKQWTAHNVNVYTAGTYTFYAGCPAGDPACGVGPTYNMTVGYGQVGVHLLFDWGMSKNIDTVLLWDMDKSWAQTGTASPIWTGGANPNGNTVNTIWDGVSIDTYMDTDNYSGTRMLEGVFVGQSINFNVHGIYAYDALMFDDPWGQGPAILPGPIPAPIPAAAWLLGTGLLGLVGVVRRRTA